MGALGIRRRPGATDEGNMSINTLSFLVGGIMGAGVMVLTDNWWYVIAVAAYGTVMNLLGFADGLKLARK
jgi:hypothetical protein